MERQGFSWGDSSQPLQAPTWAPSQVRESGTLMQNKIWGLRWVVPVLGSQQMPWARDLAPRWPGHPCQRLAHPVRLTLHWAAQAWAPGLGKRGAPVGWGEKGEPSTGTPAPCSFSEHEDPPGRQSPVLPHSTLCFWEQPLSCPQSQALGDQGQKGSSGLSNKHCNTESGTVREGSRGQSEDRHWGRVHRDSRCLQSPNTPCSIPVMVGEEDKDHPSSRQLSPVGQPELGGLSELEPAFGGHPCLGLASACPDDQTETSQE
ncbi:uncharacterized protein LOC114006316 [Tupaia chinensis]|uniref:uncharacterized protein LOC114006316 n=1 Tax=Tupaia chinensis TaxID=246437 RepID=UPI000FFB31D4|nr:uncharacterized protein LOC114006316 [Tupaia chinensis]